ncbi:MAG TPA: carcinine hydrolase/isopenicillin-N N-acyltransferase family protein, partial [Bryobacteraceae bacterium]|nr:carcinine hydrolase/isopenicillin-N N-acyltransferase family protein [Bryobacteraceae bacterium]
IADIEATTAGPELIEDHGAGYLAHSNHFLRPRYATKENHAQGWRDSFPRLDRIQGLLKARAGSLTVDDIRGYLRDHSGYPTSICRHDGNSVTVASIIAEPGERRMHVALGNPCRHEYGTYSI